MIAPESPDWYDIGYRLQQKAAQVNALPVQYREDFNELMELMSYEDALDHVLARQLERER